MIRLMINVAFAFAVATSADAMSPAPLDEPDGIVTQIRKARPCRNPNQIRLDGISDVALHMSPDPNTSVFGGEGLPSLLFGRSHLGRFVPR